ncbi:helix-turn-helix transcriptional regulator [Cellulomonas fimi]|nr:helix-turn-helix transcriptional regulator [Cellulomonas fimi]
MRRSSGTGTGLTPPASLRVRRRRADGAPVVGYDRRPGRAPVGAESFTGPEMAGAALPTGGPHAHDFLLLVHVERGSGEVTVDGRTVRLAEGDVCLLAPGQVVAGASSDDPGTRAWVVFFTADAVPGATTAPLAWRHHPLLSAFAAVGDGQPTLHLPEDERASWAALLPVLAAEAPAHGHPPTRPGTREAATAALTLLLVSVARLAPHPLRPDEAPGSVPGRAEDVATARGGDPLVTAVLAAVEELYARPVSTRDVARALGYTPGHLTTAVRERTGRTVLEWLTERRMIEARRLLAETDLPVAVVAERTGHRDAAYLVRRFREQHGVTPAQWRRGTR